MTTVAGRDTSYSLAHTLVERRLAACVNVLGPGQSVYRWKGKVETSEEYVLLIKTVREDVERLRMAVREGSGYELPEFISFDITGGDETYLNWMTAQCASAPPSEE
jgi:periplasmic divalent cation tolerance protein